MWTLISRLTFWFMNLNTMFCFKLWLRRTCTKDLIDMSDFKLVQFVLSAFFLWISWFLNAIICMSKQCVWYDLRIINLKSNTLAWLTNKFHCTNDLSVSYILVNFIPMNNVNVKAMWLTLRYFYGCFRINKIYNYDRLIER